MWRISISISNLVQFDQELAEICPFVYFPRWRTPPSWIFKKWHFQPWWHLCGPYLSPYQIWCNLIKNWRRYALLCIFQDGGRRHLEFPKSVIFNNRWHLFGPYLSAYQIWCNLIKNWRRYAFSCIFQDGGRRHLELVTFWTPDDIYIDRVYKHTKFGANRWRIGRDMPFCVFSKMAAAAILNFQKVTFWTLDDTCIARIYKHTKFSANRSRIGRDTPFFVFSKMAAAAILDLLFVDFGPPTMS